MKKRVKILLVAGALSLTMASSAYAGWELTENRYWFQYDDGTYAKSGIKNINGTDFAFDDNGYMLTGWQYIDFRWYYFEPDSGIQASGWKQVNGKWYYLDPQNFNAMSTSWLNIGRDRYYLAEDGAMQTGVFYLSNENVGSSYGYEADSSGALIRNTTKKMENRTIRYDEDGIMMYRNKTTERVAEVTGDENEEWQYVLNEADMAQQKLKNEEIISNSSYILKVDLYDEYREKVYDARGTQREDARKTWESKVYRKLHGYITENEITEYIKSVKRGVKYNYDTEYENYY